MRGKLAEVLFSGDDVEKPLRALSGGEAARLVFAALGRPRPNVLVLDEPTNHLDLEAIEALVEGLEAYDGTLDLRLPRPLVRPEARHPDPRDQPDRHQATSSAATTSTSSAAATTTSTPTAVLARARQEKKKATAAKKAAGGKPDAAHARHAKDLASKRDKLTAEIDKLETRVHQISELFCNPGFFDKTPAQEVKKLEGEQKQLQQRIEGLMSDWEKVETELAAANALNAHH